MQLLAELQLCPATCNDNMSQFNSWVAGARVKLLAQENIAAAGNRTWAPNLEPHNYHAGALPIELLLPCIRQILDSAAKISVTDFYGPELLCPVYQQSDVILLLYV